MSSASYLRKLAILLFLFGVSLIITFLASSVSLTPEDSKFKQRTLQDTGESTPVANNLASAPQNQKTVTVLGVVERNTVLMMLVICLTLIVLFFLFSKLSFDYHNKQLLQ